ncbi:MAG: hypothetical protein LLG40_15630 [Deltaproteobacteria bacterium]|nr:hypothetical protein [Deltaproteobacteria bacterium]
MSKDLNYVFNALTTHDAIKRHSSAVMGYVSLFGVTPFHLKAAKFRRIMEGMVKLFDARTFNYQKKVFRISHAGIVEALDICIKKNFNEQLENDNYLKKVMIGISEREEKTASRTAEKDLREKESGLMVGRPEGRDRSPNDPLGAIGNRALQHPDPDGDKEDAGEEVIKRITPEQAQANLQRLGQIIKSIGG